MRVCARCSVDNPGEARFCMSCGAELAGAAPSREQRKVVTILFCDLVGSTGLGESTDPEALRARMRRYFEDLRVILERHGGTVEKFVGDAVMAVFGIPVSREDDAMRAVRAAAQMRRAVGEHGLEARIGINTGEVVVGGEGETLVTGDAVNVAARFEQVAPAGQILIGGETRLLVRDAVELEPVEPLVLKGKSAPVQAYRLLEVIGGAQPLARHLDNALVGRERERRRLWRDYEDAVADGTCRLVTLLGPAGIGKSRLVADFLERVDGVADVLRGRCLSYGEGITYWPLIEVLAGLGVEQDEVLGSSPAETQLAFRRLLEARASRRPQVVVIDDLQWAEPVFLDLVEHVADLSRGVPILLLCVARNELLDLRPGWGGGKVNATSMLLEPLGPQECAELMDRLVPEAALEPALRARITESSAGNPFYVEEMLAMVRERGGAGEIEVPPTIHALLQARLDSLEGDVRVVMERGSVEGEVFHRGAVAALTPASLGGDVDAHLATLVRKELIRSSDSTFPTDEGFRFRHLLIRDAAYESLPKATRAELHELFAAWLATHELAESDEIVGYHLEQAHRYRAELDPTDEALEALAARASQRLAAAGTGALDRADVNAGVSLLQRASALLPAGDPRRLALAPELASALYESGSIAEAFELLGGASAAEDPQTRARAAVTEAILRQQPVEGGDGVREVFERAGDDYGLALYWWSEAWVAWSRVHCEETAAACERARACLVRAGADRGRVAESLRARLAAAHYFGPDHVDLAIERVQALIEEGTGQVALAYARVVLGSLLAMTGEIERARELVVGARQAFREAGMLVVAGHLSMHECRVEWAAGDDAAAERALEEGVALLDEIGDRSFHGTVALMLADLRYARGRYDDARALCATARATTEPSDLYNFILLDAVEGCLLAREGRAEDGVRQCRRAVELASSSDGRDVLARSRRFLAEALFLAGRTEEARTIGAESVAIREAKGDRTAAARTREVFEKLGLRVP